MTIFQIKWKNKEIGLRAENAFAKEME